MKDPRHALTRQHDSQLWAALMGGQSPAEYVTNALAAGVDTLAAATADIREGSEHWPAVLADAEVAGYTSDDLVASLERTLVHDGGMKPGDLH